MGQLAFFAQFLEVSGLFHRWLEGCPLSYTSPNVPAVRNVLGTWLLSILDGQRRYAHINGLRGDAVALEMLAMTRITSDESLRRALKALVPGIDKKCTVDFPGVADITPLDQAISANIVSLFHRRNLLVLPFRGDGLI